MRVQTAIERYLRHHRAAGSSRHTVKFHTQSLSQFADFAGPDTDIAELRADDLRAFLAALRDKRLSSHTVAGRARSVKAFGAWLHGEEYLPKHPFAAVSRPKVDDVVKPTFTPAEVDALLAACRNSRSRVAARDYAMMLLMFSTGLRAEEVLALTVEDVDWDKGLILVRRGKGGKYRVVPLGRKVERALLKYLDAKGRKPRPRVDQFFLAYTGAALGYHGLYSALRWWGKQAAVAVNPHKFRHSAATQYLRNGGRVEVLQKVLGHSSLTLTLHYAKIAGVDVAAAHDTADPTLSLKGRG